MCDIYLRAENVSKTFASGIFSRKHTMVIEGISLNIKAGKTVGIVGSSGTGKTTLGKIISGIEDPTNGEIIFRGRKISSLKNNGLSRFRRKVQMMFQDPEGALNPLKTIAKLFHEVFGLVKISKPERESRIREILRTIGLSEEILCRYPNQLSGGQNQRVALGRILLLEPEFIVLDEPTSSLDISVQAKVLHLLKDLQRQKELGYLFISHDFKVVEFMCDEVGYLEHGVLDFYGSTAEFMDYRCRISKNIR